MPGLIEAQRPQRGAANKSDVQPTEDNEKQNQVKKGVRACDCNADLEYDAGNGLIYNKRTQRPYTGVCVSFYDNETKRKRSGIH